jgi:hypothetical protein
MTSAPDPFGVDDVRRGDDLQQDIRDRVRMMLTGVILMVSSPSAAAVAQC